MTSSDATQSLVSTSAPEKDERHDLARWQRKLLPFMSRFIVVLAIGFFAFSLVDMYEIRNFVKGDSTQAIRAKIEELLQVKGSSPPANVDVIQQGLLLLEADALDKRYRQASALLMSRIWTRQLAFITGMVLAFIGTVFIIGMDCTSRTEASPRSFRIIVASHPTPVRGINRRPPRTRT